MHHRYKTKSIIVLAVKAHQSGTMSAKRDVKGFVQLVCVCVLRAAMVVWSINED